MSDKPTDLRIPDPVPIIGVVMIDGDRYEIKESRDTRAAQHAVEVFRFAVGADGTEKKTRVVNYGRLFRELLRERV